GGGAGGPRGPGLPAPGRAALRAPRGTLRARGRARLARDVAVTRAGVSAPRTAALVPAYQAAATIAAVVTGTRDVLTPVVVVDDGSADDTAARAAAAGAAPLRPPAHQGKGAAGGAGARHPYWGG